MSREFIADTNVLSETARSLPHPSVTAWIAAQSPIRFASITLYELSRGVRHAPAGRRQRFLEAWLAALVGTNSVVEPFDHRAALAAATIEREARRRGRPIADRDLFILATADSLGLGVATHDLSDFKGHGVRLYDPFDDVHIPG